MLVLSAIFGSLSLVNPYGNDWSRGLYSNLAAGIATSILVILLVDRVITKHADAERKRRQEIGLMSLRIPLIHHFQALFNMLKASAMTKPAKSYHVPADLFDDLFFETLGFLDFSKAAPVVPRTDWYNHLATHALRFREAIESALGKYAEDFNASLVELLEDVAASSFLVLLSQAPLIPRVDREHGVERPHNILAGEDMRDLLRAHTRQFSRLLETYDSVARPGRKITLDVVTWAADVAPSIGNSRADFPD